MGSNEDDILFVNDNDNDNDNAREKVLSDLIAQSQKLGLYDVPTSEENEDEEQNDYEFEEVWSWEYLADYFDITVPYPDVIEMKKELSERKLFIYSDIEDDWLNRYKELSKPVGQIGLYCYYSSNDVYNEMKKEKFKTFINKAKENVYGSEIRYDDIDGEEVCNVCRAFIEQSIEDIEYHYTEFWEKMIEIDNDYVFLDALQRNLDDLWW